MRPWDRGGRGRWVNPEFRSVVVSQHGGNNQQSAYVLNFTRFLLFGRPKTNSAVRPGRLSRRVAIERLPAARKPTAEKRWEEEGVRYLSKWLPFSKTHADFLCEVGRGEGGGRGAAFGEPNRTKMYQKRKENVRSFHILNSL